jgi:hypothetical protein
LPPLCAASPGQRLTAYDRPFYGRADNLILGPLNRAETAISTRRSNH